MSRSHAIWVVSPDSGWSEETEARLSAVQLGAVKFADSAGAKARLDGGEEPDLIVVQGDHHWQEALRSCRELSWQSSFRPLLVLDSACEPAVRLRFLECGADDCIKPGDLIAHISAYLLRTLARQQEDADVATTSKPALESALELAAETVADSAKSVAEDASHMYMRLGSGELSDALQFLTMSPRSGELRVHFLQNDKTGSVFLKDGEVVHVEFGDHTGMEAFARMLLQGDSEARLHVDEEAPERTVRQPVSQLLLEAAVFGDELHESDSSETS